MPLVTMYDKRYSFHQIHLHRQLRYSDVPETVAGTIASCTTPAYFGLANLADNDSCLGTQPATMLLAELYQTKQQ